MEANKELADLLSLIGSYYEMARDTYRAKVFLAAGDKILQHPTPITSGKQAENEIPGIGKSIREVIDEYLTTGKVQRLQELESKFADRKTTIDYFQSFYGIGPVAAIKFYNQGYRTLEDLWFKANLTEAQKVGIMWREHIVIPIPRQEMDLINTTIGSIFTPYVIKYDIAGSYRRGEATSGDIDVLIQGDPRLNMNNIVGLLQQYLPAKLAQGPTKFMGIFRLSDAYNGHRIDIRLINAASYPAALMYFTGSQKFNILMRQRALSLGLTLNEYYLTTLDGRVVPVTSEADIFNYLRVAYLAPNQRPKTIITLPYL